MAGSCCGGSMPGRPFNLLLKYLDRRHSTNSSYIHLVRHCTAVHNANLSDVRGQAKCRTWRRSLLGLCCTRSDVPQEQEVRSFTEGRGKPQIIVVTGNIMSHQCLEDLRVLQSIGYRIASFNLSSRRIISGMSTRKSITHYYEVLGLSPNATQGQIKAAYYKLSKLHHPDVTQCNKSHSLFTEISEAYEILGNLRKRRMYDRGVFNPRDTRGDTVVDEEAKDYTQAYKKGFNFERGNRPPPPTGRSTIYNFDEFYRQHYNDMRERRSAEFKEYVKYKEMNNKNENTEFYLPLLLVFWSLFITIGIVMMVENYDTDRLLKPQKTTDSPSHEHYFSPNSISASAAQDRVK